MFGCYCIPSSACRASPLPWKWDDGHELLTAQQDEALAEVTSLKERQPKHWPYQHQGNNAFQTQPRASASKYSPKLQFYRAQTLPSSPSSSSLHSTPSPLVLPAPTDTIHACAHHFTKEDFKELCKYHTVKPPNPGVDGLGIIHHSFSAVEVEAEEPLSDLSGITQKAYKRIRIITQISGLTSLF